MKYLYPPSCQLSIQVISAVYSYISTSFITCINTKGHKKSLRNSLFRNLRRNFNGSGSIYKSIWHVGSSLWKPNFPSYPGASLFPRRQLSYAATELAVDRCWQLCEHVKRIRNMSPHFRRCSSADVKEHLIKSIVPYLHISL